MSERASGNQARLGNIFRLAMRDLVHQRMSSFVLVTALAAVLAPLLILFGLKFGVVDNLIGKLVQDPRNRELRLIGHGRFNSDWFDQMAKRPGVAFVVPRTRGAAATIDLRLEAGEQALVIKGVELIPSALGDPLLEGYADVPQDVEAIVLSASVARQLGASAGDEVIGSVRRKRDERWERGRMSLRVTGVVPDSVFARKGAFASLQLLEASEDYRDGLAVPTLGWFGDSAFTGTRYYTGFRLYARTIDDVARLRDLLSDWDLDIDTRAKAIEEARMLDRNLSTTYWMIAIIGVIGFLLSFGASMWVSVQRKRRELSVLRLIGFPGSAIMLFPIIQSGVIAILGGALASTLFWVVSVLINNYFAQMLGHLQDVCRLLPGHLAGGLAVTFVCAVAASGLAAYGATRIEPAEGLREL